ncbi:hypothetical protein KKE92_00930 [Candidatus Micrarchaeota archaeon]|nr:hypothetical protein [Candidatus Micrarchaeota archaeon]
MDKKLIIKIIVVAVVLLFITSSIRPGTFSLGGGSSGGENITGTVSFEGTIRTYDPYLILESNINDSVVDQIRTMDGVKTVTLEAQGYIIDTETRDDVYPISQKLFGMGVPSYAIANIATPSVMGLQFGTELLNVTAPGVVRVATIPFLDAGSIVSVTMVGIANGGAIIDYHSQSINSNIVELEFTAEIDQLNSKIYSYIVPWEDRNSVTEESGDYTRSDSLLFDPALSVEQIMIKKQFSYITYIDANSAQVLSTFDNRSQIETNFADVSVIFPNSILTAESDANSTLPFNYTTIYNYNVTLIPPAGYEMDPTKISYNSELELNGTINATLEALITGNKIVQVQSENFLN